MKNNLVPDMCKKIYRIVWEIENNPKVNKKNDDQGLLKRKDKKKSESKENEYSPAYKVAIFVKRIRDKRREINDEIE